MNLRTLFLWSAMLSFLAVLGIGLWHPDQRTFDLDSTGQFREALSHISQDGKRSYQLNGLFLRAGMILFPISISAENSVNAYRDYRFMEFTPAFKPIRRPSLVFSCSIPGVLCDKNKVVVDKDARVDATIQCALNDGALDCSVDLVSSNRKTDLPIYPLPSDAALLDLQDFTFSQEQSIRQNAIHAQPFELFTGSIGQRYVNIVVFFSQHSLMRDAAEKTRFGIQENELYDIPFFDGTRSLPAHEAFLLAHVQAPHETRDFQATPIQGFETIKNRGGFYPFYNFVTYLSDTNSLFVKTLDALAYPALRTLYSLNRYLETYRDSAGALLWERRNQGSIVDRVRRLETLYVIQNNFLKEQNEQRLANAALWLENHVNETEVAIDQELTFNEIVSVLNAEKKAGVLMTLTFSGLDPNLHLDLNGSDVIASRGIRFYWIVKRNALKNGYDVMARRTPQSEENVP